MSSTAVFVGPSQEADAVRRVLPEARIEPPAVRGDLDRLRGEGVSTFLLIDGAFAHRLAVSPREIVEALRAGCRVLGAASLGAIRAAECRPAGMEGVGAIEFLYRRRVISSDDEVAVATEPEHGHRATSVALIDVRFAMLRALRRGRLDRAGAAAVLMAAKGLYFSERQWPAIFRAAGLQPGGELRELCERTAVKRRDAELALARLAERLGADAGSATVSPPTSMPPRYPGHDPLLGRTREELEPVLWAWLQTSARYPQLVSTPAATWDALEAAGELERELMRSYAALRVR